MFDSDDDDDDDDDTGDDGADDDVTISRLGLDRCWWCRTALCNIFCPGWDEYEDSVTADVGRFLIFVLEFAFIVVVSVWGVSTCKNDIINKLCMYAPLFERNSHMIHTNRYSKSIGSCGGDALPFSGLVFYIVDKIATVYLSRNLML